MEKITFLEFAEKVLKDSQKPLTHREVWNEGVKKGLDKVLSSEGKTPKNSLAAVMSMNVRRSDSAFVVASKQPITYWLKSKGAPPNTQGMVLDFLDSEFADLQSKISQSKRADSQSPRSRESKFHERDLHPLLARFVYYKFDAHAKTIHEKSDKSKKGQDKWIHPDMVAVHFPFSDYGQSTLEFAQTMQASQCVIYAFELKISLDFNNLKESYFQAVSNSSFANEGYLVVFEEVDSEVLDEVRRLRDSFGIGLIQLDCDPLKSRVVFPAQARGLDLQTIDMLVGKNNGFKEFVERIIKDIRVNEVRNATNYDSILDDERLSKHIRDKKIAHSANE